MTEDQGKSLEPDPVIRSMPLDEQGGGATEVLVRGSHTGVKEKGIHLLTGYRTKLDSSFFLFGTDDEGLVSICLFRL